jgi:predicted SAM-dependent methyltransferase
MGMMRSLVDTFSQTLGKIKKNQRKAYSDRAVIKINLGCGLAVAPGWVNIDGSLNSLVANLPAFFHKLAYRMTGANRYYSEQEYCRLLGHHTFVHHDLSYGIPFNDNAVDFVYSSHFLEHLFLRDAQALLKESLRVLKPGGVVRVSVPDLAYAVKIYNEGQKREMLENYFFVNDDDSYYARHKYMYDFSLLSEELQKAGFKNIKLCSYQQGATPDLQILDNRPDESLFVEGMK